MPTITTAELGELLAKIDRSEIVTITAETSPRLIARHPETGEPRPGEFRGLKKRATVNGVCNVRYRSCVDRQRAREERPVDALGNVLAFEPRPRAWGTRLAGKPLVEHVPAGDTDRRLYLEIKRQRELAVEYRDRRGRKIDPQRVAPFLRDRSQEGRRQLVECPVVLRDYRLDHIRQLVLRGTVYDVTQSNPKG